MALIMIFIGLLRRLQAEWPSKSLQIINAGGGVEKKEPCYIVGGNVNWYSHYGEQNGGSLKS